MNIINALFIYSLTNFFIANAMDHVPLLSQQDNLSFNTIQINIPQDIPKRLSFKTIGLYFEHLSEKKCTDLYAITNNKSLSLLSESFTFNVALLPKELTRKIIYLMLDKDEISAIIFYKIPLFYAYQKYYEARTMIEKSSLKNNKPIHLLFRLPFEKQKQIMDPLTQSPISAIIYSEIFITKKQKQEIISYPQEIKTEFFTDENIVVIDDEAEQKYCGTISSITQLGTFIGLICGVVASSTAAIMLIDRRKNANFIMGLFLGMTAFGCIIGLISGTIHFGRNARENSHPIDI